MKLRKLWLLAVLIVLGVSIFASPALASDSDDDPHPGDSSITDIDTTVGGDSTRLFSVGGADMAIDDCLATWSILFGLVQDAKVNIDCETVKEAVRLDAQGHHLAAAKMRCSTKLYRKVLGKGKPCIDAVQVVPPEKPDFNQADDERYVQQQEEIEYLREDNASIVGRLEALTERLEQRPAAVPVQVQTQIRKQESDAEQRRARAKEAYIKALKGSE